MWTENEKNYFFFIYFFFTSFIFWLVNILLGAVADKNKK
jgi:hypothetical protein